MQDRYRIVHTDLIRSIEPTLAGRVHKDKDGNVVDDRKPTGHWRIFYNSGLILDLDFEPAFRPGDTIRITQEKVTP